MNALSWLIYLASVVNSVSILSFIVVLISVLVFIAGLTFVCCNTEDYQESGRDMGVRILRHSVLAFLVCALLLIVLPGRETIYAIAASEMGEELLNSETGSKAVKALDAWLDRQITDESDNNPN